MATIKGLRFLIVELMTANPKILYNAAELEEEFKSIKSFKGNSYEQRYKAIDNALRIAVNKKQILRHIDKDLDNKVQYAFAIPKDKIYNITSSPTGKRKKQLLTAKEVRSMFAAQFNTLTRLEDVCMSIIENSEDKEKEMNKIKSFLNRK